MNPFGVNTTDANITRPLISLEVLYESMPKTQGCEQCSEYNGTDVAWCCRTLSPSMFYVEFLKVWKTVQDTWSKTAKRDLLLRAIMNYLSTDVMKGCIFWSEHCLVYQNRPLSCFCGDTIVLTDKGPRPIREIVAGNRVMTHKGRYRRVLHSISKLHTTGLRRVVTKGDLGVTCTPDHRFYSVFAKDKRKRFIANLGWCEAECLREKRSHQEGHYNCFPKIHFGSGVSMIKVSDYIKCMYYGNKRVLSITHCNTPVDRTPSSIPEEFEVSKEFLWMLGLYLAEGSCSNFSVVFSLHKDEQKTFGVRLSRYFNSLSISWSEYCSKNKYTFHVNSSVFMKFIKKMCGNGCANKLIHPDLFNLSSSQMMEIFYGWDDGDGTTKPGSGNKWRVTTVSRTLLYQMYFVLMSNDLHPFLFSEQRPNREQVNYYLCVYEADFNLKAGQGSCYKNEDDYAFYPVKCSSLVHNEQECVFDLQVEDDESFVTSSGIAHNCRVYGVVPQRSWDNRVKAFKEREGEDVTIRPQCDKVKSSKPITDADEDKWFEHTRKCEKMLGVKDATVDLHDLPGGCYRTFHDHLVLEVLEPEALNRLTEIKVTCPSKEEIQEFAEVLSGLLEDQL